VTHYTDFHPEDVKAAIRKRFGSLAKFEREHGLPVESVTNLLRGQTSRRVAAVVDAVIAIEAASIAPRLSGITGNTRKRRSAHCPNAEAA
jgi:lambda repressor-like predicted transcriptional regulator